MTSQPTPTSSIRGQLAQERLGATTKLADWVNDRRAEGKSWAEVSAALYGRTEVEISRETLRQWFGHAQRTGVAS